jgi:hypothetical protein
MRPSRETVICVQAEWDGWRTAEVPLESLSDIHWRQPARAPRALLHGYVMCSDILAGDIPHGCAETAGPHRLLVCVLKRHSTFASYAELVRRADRERAAVLPTAARSA